LIQAAWGLLLKHHTRADAAVFGATVAGRPASLPGVEDMLGLFINTLPVVIDVQPEQKMGAWLRELQASNVRWREHEHTPLYEIQRWAGSAGRPLFDSIIVFENFPVKKILQGQDKTGVRFGPTEEEGLTGFAMDLQVVIEDTLEIEYCYSRSQFPDAFVTVLRSQMEYLLEQMIQDAGRTIGELKWIDSGAQTQLLTWGHGDKRYPSDVPVHRLIERQVERKPDAIALLLGDEELSYGELNRRANSLAHRLISLGITPETRVGVALERSLEMIVGLLAVLKAGGAYVPLDTDYPVDRLTYMINDSGINLVLTQSHLRARLGLPDHIQALTLDNIDLGREPQQNPAIAITRQNLAYIIYTSGSTGQPKGVAVEHGPLAMHCQATAEIYEMGSSWRELQFMSFSFDGAHERWLTTLISGAGLALRDAELWPVEQSYQALHRYNITNAVFPPAYLGQLAEWAEKRDDLPTMELYVFGGEAMPKATFERIRQSLQPRMLINGYGPTETVVTPLIWKVDAHTSFEGTYAPIGRPVGERTAYVLDDNLQLVPEGVAGELYIGGFGLARGYFERPALTAERFIADPFDAAGGRLYRTGDLVRWLPDGMVEYLGRVDHQVKIRGFRIELGEIEARLLAIEGVDQAAVIAQPALSGSGQQLVAYIVPKIPGDPLLLPAQVKQQLLGSLPDYMIPAHILVLTKLPMTPNGKLDRQKLPQPGGVSEPAYAAPSTPEAKALAEIWQIVLKVERVGQTDNFFELGGDSLSCLQVMARIRGLDGMAVKSIKLRDLMQRPTIASLLGLDLSPEVAAATPLAMNAIRKDVLPLFCVHPGMGTVFDYQPLSRQLQGQRTVYGLPCRMLNDPAHVDQSLHGMASDYSKQILDIQPEGPYHLLGWSLGGALAALTAHFIEKRGHEVAFLGLVDTFVPGTEGPVLDDWLTDLTDFISLVMPEYDLDEAAGYLAECRFNQIEANENSIRAILGSMEVKSAAKRGRDYAGLETDELVRMFLVARHLKMISQQAGNLPALGVRPICWWSAARPQNERRALRQQIAQADLVEVELAIDHFGIIQAQDFLDEVRSVLVEPLGSVNTYFAPATATDFIQHEA
jgi:amino acid adenylation domain-containing protein